MKCNSKRIFVVLVVLMFIASSLAAKEFTLHDTEVHEIHSEIVRKDYAIAVALPRNYERNSRSYPVVYVLDGDAHFARTTDTARQLMEEEDLTESIMVGIGYGVPAGGAIFLSRRERDLTPTRMAEWSLSGGGAKFLAFIKDELIPFVDSNYRTIPEDRAIIGHSFGGLFVLYTLFNDTDTFNRYAAISPSLWWAATPYEKMEDWVTFKYEKEYAQNHTDLPVNLFLSIGSLEGINMPIVAPPYLEKFHERLESRGYASLNIELLIMDNETFMSAIPGAISRALRVLFP